MASAATWTATDESTNPARDNRQYGRIWRRKDRDWPGPRPHTHRRLSSNDGTVPTLVATIVRAHGGRTEAVSAPGGGALFRVVFLALPSDAAEALDVGDSLDGTAPSEMSGESAASAVPSTAPPTENR